MEVDVMKTNRTKWTVSGLIIAVAICSLTLQSTASAEFRQVMIPMRDGVNLAANISLPDGDGPWPVVLTRTPYNKDGRRARSADDDSPREQGGQYLEKGIAYVSQDCRGRFASEGEYQAFLDDMEDGYDTVEWLAAQDWCNGKVGMVGGSATGITTNLAAMANPPHLVCGYVTVAHGSSYRNSTHPGGLYLYNLREEWLKAQGVKLPVVPRPISHVYTAEDSKRDMREYYPKIDIPMVNVGGWYDIFSKGNIDNFMGLQYQGAQGARGQQKLLMGPFGHGRLSGDLKYPEGRDGYDQVAFFEHWLKGEDNGFEDEPAVRYFVMGDAMNDDTLGNEWRTADEWPPDSTATKLYLRADGGLTSGLPAENESVSTYTHDPNNPIPSFGGNNLMMERGPMDQREASKRDDVVVFQTEPLENAVEIAGRVTAKLFVSTEAEDTDFMVKLVDVYPDGYEALVLDGGFRMRFHDGFEEYTRVEKGKVYSIEVDLWSTALVFDKGHRIALHVASSNYPRFGVHSNTWEPILSFDDAVIADNTVHHNAARSSHVILPVTKIYE